MKIFYLSISLLLLGGCNEVYIPDPVELRIAKYSEEGHQVGGAIVNGDSWKTISSRCYLFGGCDASSMHIQAFPDTDSLVVSFLGSMQDGVREGDDLDFQFILKGLSIQDFHDMRQLNGQKYILNDQDVWAQIGRFDPYYEDSSALTPCNRGQILFRKVKHRVSDNQGSYPGYILAGTFGLECEQNGSLTTIYQGRFDFFIENGGVIFPYDTLF